MYNKELLTIMGIGVIRDWLIRSKENLRNPGIAGIGEELALLGLR